MKDTDIIKAIAELDGWEQEPDGLWGKPGHQPPYPLGGDAPDYLNSRDAIIPVIEKRQYCLPHRNLWWVIDEWLEKQGILPALKATPRQLSEALLRATGKWED
jgi:hypothetical protein